MKLKCGLTDITSADDCVFLSKVIASSAAYWPEIVNLLSCCFMQTAAGQWWAGQPVSICSQFICCWYLMF